MSKELAPNPIKTLSDALQRAAGSLKMVAASKVTPDKLIKIAIAAAQRTPLLLQCTPASIVRSVMQGAELGLTPGSALNSAYLVPFKNGGVYEAQLIVSAQGLCELMYRSGLVASVDAEVVYRGDEFEFELGLNRKLRHVPLGTTIDPKEITHAYVVVTMMNGTTAFRVMSRAEIDRIRSRSRAGNNGPWVSDYAEMARKTVIKNGSKYVPKSIEVAKAIALDNALESGTGWTGLDLDLDESVANELPESSDQGGTVSALSAKLLDDDEEEPYTGATVEP
jgi:recombination protein RecT